MVSKGTWTRMRPEAVGSLVVQATIGVGGRDGRGVLVGRLIIKGVEGGSNNNDFNAVAPLDHQLCLDLLVAGDDQLNF